MMCWQVFKTQGFKDTFRSKDGYICKWNQLWKWSRFLFWKTMYLWLYISRVCLLGRRSVLWALGFIMSTTTLQSSSSAQRRVLSHMQWSVDCICQLFFKSAISSCLCQVCFAYCTSHPSILIWLFKLKQTYYTFLYLFPQNVSMTGGFMQMGKCSTLLEVDPACSAGVRQVQSLHSNRKWLNMRSFLSKYFHLYLSKHFIKLLYLIEHAHNSYYCSVWYLKPKYSITTFSNYLTFNSF